MPKKIFRQILCILPIVKQNKNNYNIHIFNREGVFVMRKIHISVMSELQNQLSSIHEMIELLIDDIDEEETVTKVDEDRNVAVMNILRDAKTCLSEADEFIETAKERASK